MQTAKNRNHFFLMLYFKEWHQSQTLMLCSMNARGVCVEAEMIMKLSPVPGYLLMSNGAPVAPAEFARLANGSQSEIEAGLSELVEKGEFLRDEDGVYYCPRVIAQSKTSKQMSALAAIRWKKKREAEINRIAARNATRNAVRNAKRSARRNAGRTCEV